jgi:hypothetical protein
MGDSNADRIRRSNMALTYMEVWEGTLLGDPVVPMAEWAWIILVLIISAIALYLARNFVSNF